MQNFIRYGDKVIVKSEYSVKSEKGWGLLSAEGFFDDRIYFEKFSKSESLSVTLRDNIFVICPKLNSEFHKEYATSLSFYEKIEKLKNNTLNRGNMNQNKIETVMGDLKEKMIKLQEKINYEKKINRELIKNSKGSYLRYGDGFQLMHHKSKFFLNSCNVCSNTNAIGYQADISKNFNEGMVMRILPKFNSFQNGDYIQSGDEVKIQSAENEFYLTINFHDTFTDFNAFNTVGRNADTNQLTGMNIFNVEPKYGIFFNNANKNSWKVHIFQPYTQTNKQNVGWLDLIRLVHYDSNLQLTINSRNENLDKLVLHNATEEDTCDNFGTFLWQFENVRLDPDSFTETHFEKIQNFSLRNVYCSKIFLLNEHDSNITLVDRAESDKLENFSLNLIKHKAEQTNSILHNKSIKKIMEVIETKLKDTIKNNNNYHVFFGEGNNRHYLHANYMKLNSLVGHKDNLEIEICVGDPNVKDDYFIIQKIVKKEAHWIFFAISLVKYLRSFINIRNFENFLKKIDKHLIEIVMFVFDDHNRSSVCVSTTDLSKYKIYSLIFCY